MQKPGFAIPILILLLSLPRMAHAWEQCTELRIDFRVNSTAIDTTYLDNATSLPKLMDFLRDVRHDRSVNIVEISLSGYASPEGSIQTNRELAQGRLATLERLIHENISIPDSIITRNESYIPWDYLKSQVEKSEIQGKDKVLDILECDSCHHSEGHTDTCVKRIAKLKQIDGGNAWRQMHELFFSRMRNACAVFITYKNEPDTVAEPVTATADTASIIYSTVAETVTTEPGDSTATDIPAYATQGWTRRLHLKSNAAGWAMAIANIAVETDITKHWSFSLPVYYSAWNYFKQSIKFRTFAIQPELRYWLSRDNDGFFAGAHFGLAYYNFAANGSYRYQDHDGKTPAIGGGASIGYRLPISKDDRWRVEFSIGAGAYSLHYDKFHNTPDTKDGLLVVSVKKTYWGIDQVSVSFSYTFDWRRKGGKR